MLPASNPEFRFPTFEALSNHVRILPEIFSDVFIFIFIPRYRLDTPGPPAVNPFYKTPFGRFGCGATLRGCGWLGGSGPFTNVAAGVGKDYTLSQAIPAKNWAQGRPKTGEQGIEKGLPRGLKFVRKL